MEIKVAGSGVLMACFGGRPRGRFVLRYDRQRLFLQRQLLGLLMLLRLMRLLLAMRLLGPTLGAGEGLACRGWHFR